MEGIFGILSFNGRVEQQQLEDMTQTLGPTPGAEYYHDGQFGMGMKRLPLIAKIQATRPFVNADSSLCVALNGEINNYNELRYTLEGSGYQSTSDSDMELVADLYLDKGDDFLRELNGMFTLAIWDKQRQEIILAQDRYAGIRQLYYLQLPGAFIFASGIRPILSGGQVTPEVDMDNMMEFFSIGRVLPPRCLFKGIRKVVPGQVLKCRQGELSVRHGFGFSFSPEIEKENIHNLEELFSASMERNLTADKPPVFLLSGGLDSSLNVAIASRLHDRPLDTIAIGFGDEALDESAYARVVSEHFRTNHHEYTLESSDTLEVLPQIAWSQEEPISDASSVPSYHLARLAKNLTDVVVAGDGPDHLWGRENFLLERYRLLHYLPGLQLLRRLLTRYSEASLTDSRLRKILQRLRQYTNRDIANLYLEALANVLGNPPSLEFAPRLLSASLKNRWQGKIDTSDLLAGDIHDNFGRLVTCDFLVDGSFGVFAKFGKVAAEHSLLVREPHLDNPLVDFVNRLPSRYKVGGSLWQRLNDACEKKYLLRRNLAYKLLPQTTIAKKKGGFTPPIYQWMYDYFNKNNINADVLLGSSLKEADFFDTAYISDVIQEFRQKSFRRGIHLYVLLLFAVWYRVYILKYSITGPSVNLTELLTE
ncbi:MAG TPA: asparagine synthase (glutamine-hydrolyzing) [Dehalococcoidia bacterium]|nr:asparagine synthase (glutamine-hydrolyzing) [Dehalococcoidia bacterium]